ncbi:MAG: FAD-binding oxidoreductase [Caulobacterales bacterium]|nr:FAD-binding oxidoreductase [Caulobacterales bacterium]
MMISGWGRFPLRDCRVSRPRSEADVRDLIAEGALIARGNGRAYGDSALNPGNTLDMRGFNRMLSFDAESGQLVAEAGVMLADVISVFLPRGWFPAVTPGTKFVTLGGMVAADVHGKNHHHDGSFRDFVDWIDLMGADGQVRRCYPGDNDRLFDWTLGGMGLTGVILRVALRLRPVETAWIRQTTIPTRNLAAAMETFESAADATYSVAWIDCLSSGESLGRSIVTLGEHATVDELPAARRGAPFETPARPRLTAPIDAPSFALNRLTVGLFNAAYYAKGRMDAGVGLVGWDSYFYPLDSILSWNRIYGRRGFAQFQCALPLAESKRGLEAILKATSKAGQGSFLAVLKRFGSQSGAFSFPMEGYTLALDFPANPRSLRLMSELDRITADCGGRQYLAKDSRMSPEALRQSDPRVADFVAMRGGEARALAFASVQSQRLGL